MKKKPKLELTRLKEVVNLKTETECREFLRVAECGNWILINGGLPTKWKYWELQKEETCLSAGLSVDEEGLYRHCVSYSTVQSNRNESRKTISLQKFYQEQDPPISQEKLSEINNWFSENNK